MEEITIYYSHKITNDPRYNETSFHEHDKYEVLYFESGSAELVLKDKKTMLFPGTVLLVPPLTKHRVNILSGEAYKRSVIDFSKPPVQLDSGMFSSVSVIDISQNKRVISAFERMRDYSELFCGKQKELALHSVLCELLLLLQLSLKTDSINEYGHFMTSALSYINENITTVSGVSELCAELHVSRSELYREFSSALGISPMRYINRKRLIIASELLQVGEDATKVCERCGFHDYSAFYRAYRAYFGHSPKDHRE